MFICCVADMQSKSNISGRLYQLIGKNSVRTKTGRGNSRGVQGCSPPPLKFVYLTSQLRHVSYAIP